MAQKLSDKDSLTEMSGQDTASENKQEASEKTLVSRNVRISERRTSIRLEPEMWQALKDIAKRESCTVHDICTLVQVRKRKETSLTAAIRVFLMLYYKAASTEEGHRKAGHGCFSKMMARARINEEEVQLFDGAVKDNTSQSQQPLKHTKYGTH